MAAAKGTSELTPTVFKVFPAGAAGCVAYLVTFPLDTAKVQGESQALLKGQKAKYRGVFGTIFTIVRTQGLRSLYSGLLAGMHQQMCFASVWIGLYDTMKQFYAHGSESCLLNIARNAIVYWSELVTYDVIKEQILKKKQRADNMPCHFTPAFTAGFCTTIVASPVDVVKTRFMNSVPGQYGGAVNCTLTMLLKEGPSAFYKG